MATSVGSSSAPDDAHVRSDDYRHPTSTTGATQGSTDRDEATVRPSSDVGSLEELFLGPNDDTVKLKDERISFFNTREASSQVIDHDFTAAVESAILDIQSVIQTYEPNRPVAGGPEDLDSAETLDFLSAVDKLKTIRKILRVLDLGLETVSTDDEIARQLGPASEDRFVGLTPKTWNPPAASRTHPPDFEPYSHHINDLETFKKELMGSVKSSNAVDKRYKKVEALIITWENSDMETQVEEETTALKKLFSELHYKVTPLAIPHADSQDELEFKLWGFLKEHKSDPHGETLLIIYYSGHGSTRKDASTQNYASYWHPSNAAASEPPNKDPKWKPQGPTVEFKAVLKKFDSIKNQDVLFILDCCFAGAAVMHKGPSCIKEVLAACGSESMTSADKNAFTFRLIRCIRDMIDTHPVFQVATIYEYLIRISQSPLPLRMDLTSGGGKSRSIWLSSLAPQKASAPEALKPTASNQARRFISEHAIKPFPVRHDQASSRMSDRESIFSRRDRQGQTTESVTSIDAPIDEPTLPERWGYRVLLSVKLKDNILPTARDWYLNFPPGQAQGLEDIKFESLYRTKSRLLLLTMPVRQWVHLKDNPAYTFIDFVEDDGYNPFNSQTPSPEPALESAPIDPSSRHNSEPTHSSQKTMAESDMANVVQDSVRDFLDKTPNGVKPKWGFHQLAINRKVSHRLDRHTGESLAWHIIQDLEIVQNEKGDSTTFDCQFSQVEEVFENGKQSVKDTLERANGKSVVDFELETTIVTQIDQIKTQVLTGMEKIEKLMVQGRKSASEASLEKAKSLKKKKSPRSISWASK